MFQSAEAYNKIKESFKRIKKTDSTVSKKVSRIRKDFGYTMVIQYTRNVNGRVVC